MRPERGLLAPFYQCWSPGGQAFFSSINTFTNKQSENIRKKINPSSPMPPAIAHAVFPPNFEEKKTFFYFFFFFYSKIFERTDNVKDNMDELQAYMQVQQVPNDTDPLMWWNQHQQEFPDLARMVRQDLAVPDTSASPERFFSRVGLVQTDLRGSLLDTTMIDLMWSKQAP
jgi:hypothetical protein